MKRKRVEDVHVPFRINVPSGHSKFSVPIPTSYSNRKFFFSDLVVVPDFYNTEAEEFGLDVDAELEQVTHYKLNVTGTLGDKLWKEETFNLDTSIKKINGAVVSLNNWFETNKPDGLEHLGHFWDWTDIRYDGKMNLERWIRRWAIIYYGQPYDEKKHFDALPLSARSIPSCNNYLFPTELTDVLVDHLRFRMWIAPDATVLYSTDGHLKCLGFSANQIPARGGANRFHFLNRENRFLVIPAEDQPVIDIPSSVTQLRIAMATTESAFVSTTFSVGIKFKDTFKNLNFAKIVQIGLRRIALINNLQTAITYDDKLMKFTFHFPDNDQINLTINLPTELAKRLGFGIVGVIRKDKATGEAVSDVPNVEHTEKKARALAYDTGMIVVSDDLTTSNLTAGINELFMAALFPTPTGSLTFSERAFHFEPAAMKLPVMMTGGPGVFTAVFKLSRFIEPNEMVNLVWGTGAFISGVLRGVADD